MKRRGKKEINKKGVTSAVGVLAAIMSHFHLLLNIIKKK